MSSSNFFWLSNLCNCFSPQLRQNLIDYLSSQRLNQQVMQEQKCTQEIREEDESIYSQVKAKSYYTIRAEDKHRLEQQQHELKEQDNQIQFEDQNQNDPTWYPSSNTLTYEEIYEAKLKTLKAILDSEVDELYQKVYDSQDQAALIIHAKGQVQKGKKHNVYRFKFTIPEDDQPTLPQDYVQLITQTEEGKSMTQSLLKRLQVLRTQKNGLKLCYRAYEKKLVISQHDFITAQKTALEQELDEELSTEGKQIYNDVAYTTIFSIKGFKDEKSVIYNRGHINLMGLKIETLKSQSKSNESPELEKQQEPKNSLLFSGYLNVELETSVNSNMLRQPVAKQIRAYVQKLTCLLQKSDGI